MNKLRLLRRWLKSSGISLADENERTRRLTWHEGFTTATEDSVTNLHAALDQVEHLNGMKWSTAESKKCKDCPNYGGLLKCDPQTCDWLLLNEYWAGNLTHGGV
ncbi:hypothetical protein EMCRGX_G009447 [Ephydatia muelleri]